MLICTELFTKFLDSKNFTYSTRTMENGDDVVSFPYSGKVANCVFSGDNGKYFSLYLVYETIPQDKAADAIFVCNELNVKYKWATFYLNGKDVVIHDDAILSVESAADEAFELLVRILNIGNEIKPVLMKAIYA